MARGPTDLRELDLDSLRGELQRARARIEEQRLLLGEAHRHALATSRFTAALTQLSESNTLERSGLTAALVELVSAAAECLEVARVGVWLADAQFQRLECIVLVHLGVVSRRPGTVIDRALYPAYFECIEEARVLPAHDVSQHPATQELLAGYLVPLGITSLLDAPVRVFGRVEGIVCHEHLGPPRRWSEAEQGFAAHLGDFVALALEAIRRDDARRAELEAEARYRHLVENLPVTIYRLEPQRGIAYVSPRVLELTGRPASEWRGVDGLRAWLDRVHPSDRDQVRARLRGEALLDDEGIDYRVASTDPQRPERWVHDVSRAVRANDGTVLAIEGVLSDVTERALANAEVHEWERRFQALFRHGDLPMVMLDIEGRVSFASDAFLRLVDHDEGDVIGHLVIGLFGALDEGARAKAAECVSDVLDQSASGPLSCELSFPIAPRADVDLQSLLMGSARRTVRFHLTPLREATPAEAHRPARVIGAIAVGMDVTPIMDLATRNHDRDKEASISRLAAGVAHDLNNVLAAVRLTASVLGNAEDPALRKEALANLSECAKQSSELAQRLMDIARSRPTSPEDLELDPALRSIVPFLRALLVGSDHELDVHLDATDAWVRIGITELRQILLNLVANARDASPRAGRITLRSTTLVLPDPTLLGHDLPGGAFGVIEVEDHGPGIADELRSRIFEPYFTHSPGTHSPGTHSPGDPSPGSRSPSGSGLGLASSRGLARQMGGDLRAERGNDGARLVLLLPRRPAPA